jgi:hypothetical protein
MYLKALKIIILGFFTQKTTFKRQVYGQNVFLKSIPIDAVLGEKYRSK